MLVLEIGDISLHCSAIMLSWEEVNSTISTNSDEHICAITFIDLEREREREVDCSENWIPIL